MKKRVLETEYTVAVPDNSALSRFGGKTQALRELAQLIEAFS
jgi:hypothetical protein